MLLIIVSTGDELFRYISISDLELNSQNRRFWCFAIFGCCAHFNSESRRNSWRL